MITCMTRGGGKLAMMGVFFELLAKAIGDRFMRRNAQLLVPKGQE
jgi:hypothetical protein